MRVPNWILNLTLVLNLFYILSAIWVFLREDLGTYGFLSIYTIISVLIFLFVLVISSIVILEEKKRRKVSREADLNKRLRKVKKK